MKVNLSNLNNRDCWTARAIRLPLYNISGMADLTRAEPIWVHFGAGNIFRGFIAGMQQQLLNKGLAERGIIAAETFDFDIIDRIYKPYDNLVINVTLNADATIDCEITASIAEAVKWDSDGIDRLSEIFTQPNLQMASLTITEKGYSLRGADGAYLPDVEADARGGPGNVRHIIGVITALLYKRYNAGGLPLAVVSLDNCQHNGGRLCSGVMEVAGIWAEKGLVSEHFLEYLQDGHTVSFPWSMIDKITPRPDESVGEMLAGKGVEGMTPVITGRKTFIAPFVNAERPSYLVIEDSFPNGRPPLEQAGVYFTDRETVNKAERMKVTACLNPLHTAMSIYGCLLGYKRISDEMRDPQITALIKRLGYDEGLPVVADPAILSPKAFIDEVIGERLPNPFMPDTPQRIATDTSQKIGIRFGETIKSYIAENRDLSRLIAIPLSIAGWLRYLLGMDDAGSVMEVSPDPLKTELQGQLTGVVWNNPLSYRGQAPHILSNTRIFGLDLTKTILGGRIEAYFTSLLEGPGAVRRTLQRNL